MSTLGFVVPVNALDLVFELLQVDTTSACSQLCCRTPARLCSGIFVGVPSIDAS